MEEHTAASTSLLFFSSITLCSPTSVPEININTNIKNESNKNSHTEVIAQSYLNDSPVEEGIRLKEICGYLPDTFGSSGGRLMEKGKGK